MVNRMHFLLILFKYSLVDCLSEPRKTDAASIPPSIC